MMDAVVFNRDGASWVSLRLSGEEVDEAGPFDDEAEALMMAERSVYDGGSARIA